MGLSACLGGAPLLADQQADVALQIEQASEATIAPISFTSPTTGFAPQRGVHEGLQGTYLTLDGCILTLDIATLVAGVLTPTVRDRLDLSTVMLPDPSAAGSADLMVMPYLSDRYRLLMVLRATGSDGIETQSIDADGRATLGRKGGTSFYQEYATEAEARRLPALLKTYKDTWCSPSG